MRELPLPKASWGLATRKNHQYAVFCLHTPKVWANEGLSGIEVPRCR